MSLVYDYGVVGFLRRHVVGLLALFVALSGTAFAVTNGSINGKSVKLRHGQGANGAHTDTAACHTGETVVGGGGEVLHLGNNHALTTSRPYFHAGNGSQGWTAAASGGGTRAWVLCVSP
jgi:hypothetical protein